MTDIRIWMRVIRVRFLLASVIAVVTGLAVWFWQGGTIDAWDATLTVLGILALHASVDLLNDYWDYRRGIDSIRGRTKMSGGTGVLAEGLLRPESVYRAGIAFLAAGACIGAYFVVTDGPVIAALLGFAIVSIYFYSTRIVDSGLAEVFVAAKGCMIVMGTYFIQAEHIGTGAALAGIAVGALSSLVLFVASYPDHDADRSGGRRTLVILLGKKGGAPAFWLFVAASYAAILAGMISEALPFAAVIVFGAAPLAFRAGKGLARHYADTDRLLPYMEATLLFGRVSGALLVIGLVAAGI